MSTNPPIQATVVSPVMAKALRDAGWNQEITVKEKPQSQYVYIHEELHLVHVDNDTDWILGNDYQTRFDSDNSDDDDIDYCVAPTAEEILRLLPKHLNIPKADGKARAQDHTLSFGYHAHWDEGKDAFCSYLHTTSGGKINQYDRFDTLSNAAATMWIYLTTSKLL